MVYRGGRKKGVKNNKPIPQRFWEKVTKTDTCWLWMAATAGPQGFQYGRFWNGTNTLIASRYSWQLHHGPIPEGMYVLHTCDVPLCVNPFHLFLGTQKQNMQDCAAKHRNGAAKFSETEIRRIRSSTNQTLDQLAHAFHTTKSNIHYIRKGTTWQWVTQI